MANLYEYGECELVIKSSDGTIVNIPVSSLTIEMEIQKIKHYSLGNGMRALDYEEMLGSPKGTIEFSMRGDVNFIVSDSIIKENPIFSEQSTLDLLETIIKKQKERDNGLHQTCHKSKSNTSD